MKIKFFTNILIYISLGFLGLYLYREGIYSIPVVYSWPLLIFSMILLFSGHLIYVLIWYLMLRLSYKINPFVIFESESITIFNKYIPGKIWVVIGPVAYLKKFHDVSFGVVGQKSLYMQVIILWTGLLLGLFFLGSLSITLQMTYVVLFAAMTLYLFTNKVHAFIERLITLVLKKEINFIVIDCRENFAVLVWSVILWLVWSVAYYCLILATTNGGPVPFSAAFVFPIASVIGIVALLAPGGLGVREGMMVVLLMSIGVASHTATEVSINARLWFLSHECIIFIMSIVSIVLRRSIGGSSV